MLILPQNRINTSIIGRNSIHREDVNEDALVIRLKTILWTNGSRTIHTELCMTTIIILIRIGRLIEERRLKSLCCHFLQTVIVLTHHSHVHIVIPRDIPLMAYCT